MKNIVCRYYQSFLRGHIDEYLSFHVEKGKYLDQFLGNQNYEQFMDMLKTKEQETNLIKAIWIELSLEQLSLAQILVQNNYQMHHCSQNYLLLNKWLLLDEPSRLPEFASFRFLIIMEIRNDEQKVLHLLNSDNNWIMPQIRLNSLDLISECIIKYLEEQHQIKIKINHLSDIKQDELTSDIFITVTGKIIQEHIDEHKYKWIQRDESKMKLQFNENTSLIKGINKKFAIYS